VPGLFDCRLAKRFGQNRGRERQCGEGA
jgi:hypothetical protein